MRNLALTLTALTIASAACLAGDWPGYGGPNRTNVLTGAELPKTFPPGGPKVLWKINVGIGYGGAAVKDGEVYLLDRVARRSDVMRCLDLASGTEKWSVSYPAPGRLSHAGSRSVPSVDDEYVFTVGGFGHVTCFGRQSRKRVWSKNLMRDFGPGAKLPHWGWSQSALLYKDTVIVAPQSNTIGLAALDKATGQRVWASEPVGAAHYVSPLLITIDGVEQVVIVNKSGATAFDPASGSKLWRFGGWTCKISIPNVTNVGQGRVVITGGYGAGTVMIQVTRTGEKWTATKLWRNDEINSQMNPALLCDGHLYFNSNSNERSDGLTCTDLDGKIRWRTGKNPNFERGHMMLVDGMLYIIEGKKGSLHLVKLSPEGYREVGRVEGLLGGREIWAPLSLSGTKLIIRDQSKMLCLDLAKGK